jgi:streptogramin lyase
MANPLYLTPRHLTTAQGLPSNYVYTVAQDAQGYIWLGSTGGLSRFDGYRFQNFTNMPLSNEGLTMTPSVVRMEVDHGHHLLWLRSGNYVFFCHDTKNGSFLDYTGRGDQQRTFREIQQGPQGIVWLYQDANGARRVKYTDGKFECIDYTLKNKQLPCQEF